MNQAGLKVKRMAGIAMLGAMGFMLMFFPVISIIPGFAFLKLDFSDITVLIGMFLYGPLSGVGIALCRSVLHYMITGMDISNFIGDTASFIASVVYTLPIFYVLRKGHRWQFNLLGSTLGTISLTLVMGVLNYLIITPLYIRVLGLVLPMSLGRYVLIGVIPFNLVKGIIVSALFIVLYAKLIPWLQKSRIAVSHHSNTSNPKL